MTTSTDGLEVHWWLTDDIEGIVGATLGPFVEPLRPPDEALRARWEAAGLRLVRAPVASMFQIEQSLPSIQQRHRQWVGWATRWTEVFRGRPTSGIGPVIIDGAARTLPRGTLRVLARCWPAPAQATGPEGSFNVRIELLFQHVPEEAPTAAAVFTEPKVRLPEDEGELIASLSWTGALEPGFVYVIAPESPGLTWGGTKKPAAPSDTSPPDQPTPAPVSGPAVRGPPTLGEAMMAWAPGEAARGAPKAVIMLLPRPPSEYRLLP